MICYCLYYYYCCCYSVEIFRLNTSDEINVSLFHMQQVSEGWGGGVGAGHVLNRNCPCPPTTTAAVVASVNS